MYVKQFFAACLFRAKVQVNHFGRKFQLQLEFNAQTRMHTVACVKPPRSTVVLILRSLFSCDAHVVLLFPFAVRRLLEISSPVIRHQIRQISFIVFVDSSPEVNFISHVFTKMQETNNFMRPPWFKAQFFNFMPRH